MNNNTMSNVDIFTLKINDLKDNKIISNIP